MAKGYITEVHVTDLGPFVTKFILPVGTTLKDGCVDKDTFTVYCEKFDMTGKPVMVNKRRPSYFGEQVDKAERKGYISLRDAYVCDLNGDRQDEGEYIALTTVYGPFAQLPAEVEAVNGFNAYVATFHTIIQTKDIVSGEDILSGLVFDRKIENRQPDLYGWTYSVSSYKEMPLKYGYFVPQAEGGLHPLIIWLHGAGEGGQDPKSAYSANKVVALSQKYTQDLFGGAYVLAPQTPTYWMDNGSGHIENEGLTIYIPALKALIDEFVAKNPGIDTNRIYIGGDSNGGFMTVKMIIEFPDFFAGAFPVCEAVPDWFITDEMLKGIVDLPVWFTTALTDTLVEPEKFALPTYRRLIAMGAKDVHVTCWDNVKDIHGAFDPVNGEPYEYFGHFSWVPMLNDDCKVDYDKKPVVYNGKEVTLLQWLAQHSK